MTCIIGLVNKEGVWIGGDSLGSDKTFRCQVYINPKVFRNKDFIIGYTTSFRMGQILEHVFVPPRHIKKLSNIQYMVKEFIPSIIKLFEKEGFLQKEDGVAFGGSFIVGYRGSLFTIEGDMQVAEYTDGIHSVGCGSKYATGAMAALLDVSEVSNQVVSQELNPEYQILHALNITEKYSAGVRGPFTILKL